MRRRLKTVLFFAVALVSAPAVVLADGAPGSSDWVAPTEQAQPDATPNQASDASFDKRLPPVFPGETVSDSGRKIKVWSTSGPVPVSSPPEPWKDNTVVGAGADGAGVSVIVDRERERRDR